MDLAQILLAGNLAFMVLEIMLLSTILRCLCKSKAKAKVPVNVPEPENEQPAP